MKQQTANIILKDVPIVITEDKQQINISFKIPEGKHKVIIAPIKS